MDMELSGSQGAYWYFGPLMGEVGVSLNPKTQATPSSLNQTSSLRTVYRWAQSSARSKGQGVSKPTLLTGSHYRA